jgi:iron complex outermembrane receptor protein
MSQSRHPTRSTPAPALRRLLLAGGATLCMTGWAQAGTPAQAAVTASAAAADESAGVAMEEVIVTARRRDEDAQTVPIALNAFTGASLEARRAYNVRDLQALAPSLVVTVTNPRNTSINIRGLGNNVSVYNDGLQPAVGVYIDQVFYGRPGQTVFDLADIGSVEVLRGPQGTLFGKDTSAGAVVISTNAPRFTPEASADVSVGNYDYVQGHLVVGGPIVADKVAGRLTLSQTQHGGYADNVYAGTKTQDYRDWSLRGQLLFTPNDQFKLRLSADYGQQRSSTASAVVAGLLTSYTDGTAYPFGYLQRLAAVGVAPLPIDPHARLVQPNGLNNYWEEQGGVSAVADLKLDGFTVTSVTAARTWNWSPHNDGDGTPADAGVDFHQSNQQTQFSQELRFATTGDRKVDYVGGAYFFWQDIKATALNAYGSQAANWFISPAAAPPQVAAAALNDYTIVSHSSPKTVSYAVFAEGVWHATPKLDATLGLRYTYEKMTGYFRQTASGQDLSGLTAAQQAQAQALRARYGVANSFEAETDKGSVTGRASLSYKWTPDLLTYATYSRGYKAGGLNLSNINTVGSQAVDPVVGPETIDAYELGLKSAWFDKRLTANLALFWTEDSNYQTTQVNLVNGVSSLTNAGKVRSRGVEVDLQAQPIDDLSLYASATYDDASYLSYKNAPCPIEVRTTGVCDLSGLRLPGPSLWAVSAGGEYRHDVAEIRGARAQAYLGADYSYRSSFYTTAADSIYSRIPAYGLLNLRAGVRAADGAWDVQVWARNVGDSDYWQSLSAANTGAITGTLGDPRTYGVTLKARY